MFTRVTPYTNGYFIEDKIDGGTVNLYASKNLLTLEIDTNDTGYVTHDFLRSVFSLFLYGGFSSLTSLGEREVSAQPVGENIRFSIAEEDIPYSGESFYIPVNKIKELLVEI